MERSYNYLSQMKSYFRFKTNLIKSMWEVWLMSGNNTEDNIIKVLDEMFFIFYNTIDLHLLNVSEFFSYKKGYLKSIYLQNLSLAGCYIFFILALIQNTFTGEYLNL